MKLHDERHPIWPLISTFIFMTALTVILYTSATTFDITELRTLLAFFVVVIGKEGALPQLRKWFENHSKESK